MLSRINDFFLKKEHKRNYYVVYTALFVIIALFSFSWFYLTGRSLIWDTDGWHQHLKALIYYGRYLRQIAADLISQHRLILPDWDQTVGEGSDVLAAFHYYVIGDPIAFFAVFVPSRFMQYFYDFSCVFRLYLAGAAFSELAFETDRDNRYAVLAGALSYSFCAWGLYNVARHPFFLNPMIYFPLVILGIERIIRKKSPFVFIISAAVAAISNFYFFYMIVVLAVVYTLVRLGFVYKKDMKSYWGAFWKIGGFAVLGVAIAGVILLPVLYIFTHDSRLTSSSQPFHLFYPLKYYSALPSVFLAFKNSFWLCIGLTAPVVLAVFLLFFKRKTDTFLKVMFVIGIVIMLFPILGRFLNGMSYMSNRWSWAFDLLCAYILTKEWDDLLEIGQKIYRKLVICTGVIYLVCVIADRSRGKASLAAIIMVLAVLFVLGSDLLPQKRHVRELSVFALVCISVVNMAYWRYAPEEGNYVNEALESAEVDKRLDNNELKLFSDNEDGSYIRITGRCLTKNANILEGIASTQYYWSISNSYLNQYRDSLNMRENSVYDYEGYDDRTTPIALSSVNYFVTRTYDNRGIPYGYTQVTSANTKEKLIEEYTDKLKRELSVEELTEAQADKLYEKLDLPFGILKNEYALPLGYCYDSYIPAESYDSLDPVQKQESQLSAVYLAGKEPQGISEFKGEAREYTIPYEISFDSDEISVTAEGIVTTADSVKATVTFEGLSDAETYIAFEGFDFKPTTDYDLYFGDDFVDPLKLYNKTNWERLSKDTQIGFKEDKLFSDYLSEITIDLSSSHNVNKKLGYTSPDSQGSSGRHDFIVNMGYQAEAENKITIEFPVKGRYFFDQLKIYCVPMGDYKERVSALKENSLKDVKMDVDIVSGTIELSDNKLMVMAIPYSAGWTAYIDGVKTETFLANERHIGIEVPAGHHSIELRYSTPWKKAGALLSLAGIFGTVILAVLLKRKKL